MNAPNHAHFHTPAARVHDQLRTRLLVDGFDFVFDPVASQGATLVCARTGRRYLDLFSFFASQPVGFNHPGMDDADFREKLLLTALSKPTNSDVYTQAFADFVAAFSRTLPPTFEHLFFIEGGAAGVENSLKVAFDWKVQKNLRRGLPETVGTRAAHFQWAFHGRSGYTLSMTNTFDKRKTQYFPKFDWPRLTRPALEFPVTPEVLDRTRKAEQEALAQLKDALVRHPHDVACVIIETIQGEGGDAHFRTEFMQALRDICNNEEMLLIFDEVQSGFGLTGRWWAFEHHGVAPDIFCFGKKAQVCGIAATTRCDDVDSVFKVPSRINSTWGGNLVDMVRATRFIEIIEQQELLANAGAVGAHALTALAGVAARFPALVTNVRGRGLMCAFDLPTPALRDRTKKALYDQDVLILPCGSRSLRFRPVLDLTRAEVDEAAARIARALETVA